MIKISAFSVVLYDVLQDNAWLCKSLPSFRLIYIGAVKPRINRENGAKSNLSVQGTDLNPFNYSYSFTFGAPKLS